MKGNRMKKPVKKKMLGGILGLAAKGLQDGPGGILKFSPAAQIAHAMSGKKKEDAAPAAPSPKRPAKTAAPLMRNKMSYGGKVTKKATGGRIRGDGICQRGKTKGEMR